MLTRKRRPVYETKADLERERATAAAVARRLRLNAYKARRFLPYDYVYFKDDRRVLYAEVKNRPTRDWRELEGFGTYMISAHKVDRLIEIGQETGIPTAIVVSDCLGEIRMTKFLGALPFGSTLRRGGRTDRGDDADIELVYHIPVYQFERVTFGSGVKCVDPVRRKMLRVCQNG